MNTNMSSSPIGWFAIPEEETETPVSCRVAYFASEVIREQRHRLLVNIPVGINKRAIGWVPRSWLRGYIRN